MNLNLTDRTMVNPMRKSVLIFLLFFLSKGLFAQQWNQEDEKTNVTFTIKNFGILVTGNFNSSNIQTNLTCKDLKKSYINAEVVVNSIAAGKENIELADYDLKIRRGKITAEPTVSTAIGPDRKIIHNITENFWNSFKHRRIDFKTSIQLRTRTSTGSQLARSWSLLKRIKFNRSNRPQNII